MSLLRRVDRPLPTGTDAGLLVLRIGAGASLFIKHGLEKLTGYSKMVQHFPDPIHIGAHAGLAFALFSDGICSILVLLGVFTRPACAVIIINLLTAFFFVHHASFLRDGHSELIVVYVFAFASLLLAGPGRWSSGGRTDFATRESTRDRTERINSYSSR